MLGGHGGLVLAEPVHLLSALAVVTEMVIAASSVQDDGQMCWAGMVALYWLNLSTCCLSSLACSPSSPQAVVTAASSEQWYFVATKIAQTPI